MRKLFAAGLTILLCAEAVHALPVIPSAPIPVTALSSQYKVGFSLNPANAQSPVYRFFSEKLGAQWGPWNELRMDANPALEDPAFKASVNQGTVRLSEWGPRGGLEFAGDASQLLTVEANFGWNYGYNIGFVGNTIDVDLEVNFDWSKSAITDATTRQNTANAWESDIEQWWNKPDAKILFTDPTGTAFAYPIRFDVTLTGHADGAAHNAGIFDQLVTVWDPASTDPGKPGGANMTEWFDTSNGQTAAHEFGHMLGLFDEYWAGAVDTATYATDYESLMGSYDPLSTGGGMKPMYYESFRLWLAGHNPGSTLTLLLPEPPTLSLLLATLALLRYTRPWLRKTRRDKRVAAYTAERMQGRGLER